MSIDGAATRKRIGARAPKNVVRPAAAMDVAVRVAPCAVAASRCTWLRWCRGRSCRWTRARTHTNDDVCSLAPVAVYSVHPSSTATGPSGSTNDRPCMVEWAPAPLHRTQLVVDKLCVSLGYRLN